MKRAIDRWEAGYVSVVFLAGLTLRFRLAVLTYLNPDEARHALLSFGTWGDALRGSLTVTHPPLLIMLTHAVSFVSRGDLAMRLIPVLAGSVFPLLLYAWIRRIAGAVAGMAALFLLTLAPHLISLSAQLRSYTLALLFLSASLLVLEIALDRDRWQLMAGYSVLLWLCILSDYSMAWFVGAAGFYALLRLRGSSAGTKTVWAAGQLVGLAIYGLLFEVQVRAFRGTRIEREAWSGWLRKDFPGPGDRLVFPLANTLRQFAYFMASVPLGLVAAVLFGIAVVWLWTGRTAVDSRKARAVAVLLVLPFLLAIAGAYAHQFPYGRTRHTVIMGVFAAAGIGIFLATLPRRAGIAIVWGMLLLTPLWLWKATPDIGDISSDRNRKALLLKALEYMRTNISPSSPIFTQGETLDMLAYYEGASVPRCPDGRFFETAVGGWRIVIRDYGYATLDDFTAALAAFRSHYGLAASDPVWVLDGGWALAPVPSDPARPFTKVMQVFQAGAAH